MRWIPLVFVCGCFLEPPAKDGEACANDSSCASGFCEYGFCRGSDCSHDACEANWQCVHDSGGIFSDASDTCVPLCGSCPLNYSCAAGETGLCSDTPAPSTVTVTADKANAMLGEQVDFSVVATSPRGRIVSYAWYFHDGAEPADGDTTASHAFTYVGMQLATVEVKDQEGVATKGSATVQVCGPVGYECGFDADCCNGTCSPGLICM